MSQSRISRLNSHQFLTQSYPDLQPLYEAARSYLEIPQRVNLLNTRVEVRLPRVIGAMDLGASLIVRPCTL